MIVIYHIEYRIFQTFFLHLSVDIIIHLLLFYLFNVNPFRFFTLYLCKSNIIQLRSANVMIIA